MRLFIDADAFPNLLKPLVLKAIQNQALKTYVVSNKKVSIGESPFIEYIVVSQGVDEADNYIVDNVQAGDLVLSADIPLADRVVSKKANVLNFRGEFYDEENIKHHLVLRNLMSEIRDSGEITRGPAPFSEKDK
jgi:hypothetical protein